MIDFDLSLSIAGIVIAVATFFQAKELLQRQIKIEYTRLRFHNIIFPLWKLLHQQKLNFHQIDEIVDANLCLIPFRLYSWIESARELNDINCQLPEELDNYYLRDAKILNYPLLYFPDNQLKNADVSKWYKIRRCADRVTASALICFVVIIAVGFSSWGMEIATKTPSLYKALEVATSYMPYVSSVSYFVRWRYNKKLVRYN
jgi:hypothetical protein